MKGTTAADIQTASRVGKQVEASGKFSQQQLDKIRKRAVELHVPHEKYVEQLLSLLPAAEQHAEALAAAVPAPKKFKIPEELKGEYKLLQAAGPDFKAFLLGYIVTARHDHISTLRARVEKMVLDNTCPVLTGQLRKIIDNLGKLNAVHQQYASAASWVACDRESNLLLRQQIMEQTGWIKGENLPPEAHRSNEACYKLLRPLPQHYQQGSEQLFKIATLLEAEYGEVEKANDALALIRQLAHAAKLVVPVLERTLDEMVDDGVDRGVKDQAHESRLAAGINWHAVLEDPDTASAGASATDENQLSAGVAQMQIDVPAQPPQNVAAPAPSASPASAVAIAAPVTVTGVQKDMVESRVKECNRKAAVWENDARRISTTLSGNIKLWHNRRRTVNQIRDDSLNPTNVEFLMHKAANEKKRAAAALMSLAKALERQGGDNSVKAEVAACKTRANKLLEQEATLRKDGTAGCLALIAQMPTQEDFLYLVKNRHIAHVDQPTSFPINKYDDMGYLMWGNDGQPQKEEGHEYRLHLRDDSSFVVHFKYGRFNAEPGRHASHWAHMKTSAQAKLGYGDQVDANRPGELAQKIWRGEIDPKMALDKLHELLPEDQRLPVREVARPRRAEHLSGTHINQQ